MIDRTTFTDDTAVVVTHPDPRNGLILNTYIDGQRVIGLSQPTDWSPEGLRMAARTLQTCLQSLQATRYMVDMSDAQRLSRAVGEANDFVRSHNRMRAGHDHEAAIGVGLALIVRRDRNATLALMPPAAVVLFQGSTVRWIPELVSWSGKQPGIDGAPLGWSAVPRPTIVKTQSDPNDEIGVISSRLAEGLVRDRIGVTSSSGLTQALCDVGNSSGTDCDDMVALVTRFEPGSITRNVRAVTGSLVSGTDRRARAVWAAFRSGNPPSRESREPQVND
jgi:hypothetical protein